MGKQQRIVSLGEGKYSLCVDTWLGAKTPIILLNGSLFHREQFFLLRHCGFHRLLSDHTLVAFDYGGTGSSRGVAPPWSMDRLVAELAAVVDAVSPQAPVHLFGLSKGTIVAQAFAAQFPNRVASIGGYGFFHFGFSEMARVEQFFRNRLRHFSALAHEPLAPLRPQRFAQLWADVERYVFSQSGSAVKFIASPLLQKIMFRLLQPTPLATLYAWFDYAVSMFGACPQFFNQHREVLATIPFCVQHSQSDGTLPFAMAQQLVAALGSRAQLVAYSAPYNHTSPCLLPWQAIRVITAYRQFLQNI